MKSIFCVILLYLLSLCFVRILRTLRQIKPDLPLCRSSHARLHELVENTGDKKIRTWVNSVNN